MTPNNEAVQRVVMAGMKLMYDPKVFPMFSEALEKNPSPQGIARQAAGLMKILMDKSQGTIPQRVVIPSAMALLFEMTGFMVQAGMPKPSDADMQEAAKTLIGLLIQVFGGQGGGQPPAGMAPGAEQPPAQPPAAQPGLIGG